MAKPLTIFSLISSEGYYGAENMLVTLAQNLCRLDCHCIVGVFCDSRFPHTEVAEQATRLGLAVETLPCQGRADWKTVRQIRHLVAKHRVDVLNPHGYKADLYAYAAAWPNRAALVATSHNWPNPLLKMRVYAAIDKLVLRRFDKVIGVSEVPLKVLCRWGVPTNKLTTIFNGVDVERFGDATPSLRHDIAADGSSLVGFIGRFVADKGGALLLHAASEVLAVRPKTMFVFAGDGPAKKEWEALATQLRIKSQVRFVGVRDDMPAVFASLDIVVLPSLVESMPMCLLEAMASGKPVIATRVGAVSRLIISEQSGLLVEPGDVSGLVAAILRVLGSPELSARLGSNARARAARHFSAEVMARNYLQQFETVLDNRRNQTSS